MQDQKIAESIDFSNWSKKFAEIVVYKLHIRQSENPER
jgi:hypothetical protein